MVSAPPSNPGALVIDASVTIALAAKEAGREAVAHAQGRSSHNPQVVQRVRTLELVHPRGAEEQHYACKGGHAPNSPVAQSAPDRAQTAVQTAHQPDHAQSPARVRSQQTH